MTFVARPDRETGTQFGRAKWAISQAVPIPQMPPVVSVYDLGVPVRDQNLQRLARDRYCHDDQKRHNEEIKQTACQLRRRLLPYYPGPACRFNMAAVLTSPVSMTVTGVSHERIGSHGPLAESLSQQG